MNYNKVYVLYVYRYPTLESFIFPCGNNVSPFSISKGTFETEVFINLKTMWKLVPIVLARDPSLRRLVFIILWLLRVKFWTRYFLHKFPTWFSPRFSFRPERIWETFITHHHHLQYNNDRNSRWEEELCRIFNTLFILMLQQDLQHPRRASRVSPSENK